MRFSNKCKFKDSHLAPADIRRQFALLDFSFMNVDRSVSLAHTTLHTSSVVILAEPVSVAGGHGLSFLLCPHWEDCGV